MRDIWLLLFGFFPPWFQIVLLVGIAVLLLAIVIAIVQAVLAAIPFL